MRMVPLFRMLVTYGSLSHGSIEADEATEESRLLHGNCYFLGVLKGVERTLYRDERRRSRLTFYQSHRHERRCYRDEDEVLRF